MNKDIWVEKFCKEAAPVIFQAFKPSKMLIFGSRIKGNATANSDLDVIVVSDHFNTVPFIKRMALLSTKARFPKHVDYLCYTSEEFERVKISSAVIQEALQTCQEVEKDFSEAGQLRGGLLTAFEKKAVSTERQNRPIKKPKQKPRQAKAKRSRQNR